jgi:hypothetical protein
MKNFITNSCTIFTFTTINNSKISPGLKTFLDFSNQSPSRAVPVNSGNSGHYANREKITSFNFCKFCKNTEMKTSAKLQKMSKIWNKGRINNRAGYKEATMRVFHRIHLKQKTFHRARKTRISLMKRSFWTCKWKKTTCTSYQRLTETFPTLFLANSENKSSFLP